jgi:dihydroxyacetone kinase
LGIFQRLAAQEDPVQAFSFAAKAAVAGAEATKSMPALAGRSSYVPAQVLATVPDPGAMAAAAWLMAAATAITQDLGIS